MPKLYYLNPDEAQGARPLNEQLWFPRFHSTLLRLVNTNEGRDLYCLDSWSKRPYPIVKMRKNSVTYYLGQWDGEYHYLTDVRVGAKWGNVTRHRWKYIRHALVRMAMEEMLAWPLLGGRQRQAAARFTTAIVYPEPDAGSTTSDGYLARTTNGTFASMRDGAGETANNNAVQCIVNNYYPSNWGDWIRGQAVYDISEISGSDVIDSATQQFVCDTIIDPFTDALALVVAVPADNANLSAADFQAMLTTVQATNINFSAGDGPFIDSGGTNYNTFTINPTGLTAIEAAADGDGILPQGWITEVDRSNIDPSPSAGNDSACKILSADNTGTSKDPKLIILHTSTFTPKVMMF